MLLSGSKAGGYGRAERPWTEQNAIPLWSWPFLLKSASKQSVPACHGAVSRNSIAVATRARRCRHCGRLIRPPVCLASPRCSSRRPRQEPSGCVKRLSALRMALLKLQSILISFYDPARIFSSLACSSASKFSILRRSARSEVILSRAM